MMFGKVLECPRILKESMGASNRGGKAYCTGPPESVFLIMYGAQELMPRNGFYQSM